MSTRKSRYGLAKAVFEFAIAVSLLGPGEGAFAAAINVDLKAGQAVYSGTALAPDPGTKWNGVGTTYYPGSSTITSGALADSTNGSTSVTFTLSNVSGYNAGGAAVAPALMGDYAAIVDSGTKTFTISGLVPGVKYNLYLYAQNGQYGASSMTFTFGATNKTALNSGNPSSFIDGNNYVVFSFLTAAGDGTLSGTITSAIANGAFNGFQLMPAPAPTPMTVNVDFNDSPGASGTYCAMAVAPDTGTNWNGIIAGPNQPDRGECDAFSLADSTGGVSSVFFTLSNVGGWDVLRALDPTKIAAIAPALMNDFAVIDTGPETLTINGLIPGAKYRLYLYSENAGYGSANTTFTFGGTSQTVLNSGNLSNFVAGTNYTVFLNLTATDGILSGTMASTIDSGGAFNGFQLMWAPPPMGTVFCAH